MKFNDKGPWTVSNKEGHTIESDDFTHDVMITIGGDFESNKQRYAYAQGLAEVLNKHKENNNG